MKQFHRAMPPILCVSAPLYVLQTDAGSGKQPGAVVTLNPFAAAATPQ